VTTIFETPAASTHESRFEALFGQAAAGIVQVSAEGRLLVVNPYWCERLGYSEADLLQRHLRDIVHPEDVTIAEEHLAALVGGGDAFSRDVRFVRRDGTILWAVANVASVRDGNGAVHSLVALFLDLTASKAATLRAEFVASLARTLATMTDAGAIMRHTCAEVGRYIGAQRCHFVECHVAENRVVIRDDWVADPSLRSFAGTYSLFDYGGIDWWRRYSSGNFSVEDVLSDPLTRERAPTYLRNGVRSYAVQPFRRDADWTVVLAVTDATPRAWRDEDMSLLEEVIARAWPLVERARSEAAAERGISLLRETVDRQNRLYHTILSSTPDLIYVFDKRHRFTYANRALLELWGRSWDEAIGKTCLELGYPEWHAAMHDREIDQVVATGQPVRGEVPFAGTGGVGHYDYIFVPVFGADGEVEAVAGTTRDVTESRRAETVLQAQVERERLLCESAGVLLTTDDPDAMLRKLFARVAPHFGIDAYFNFMVEDGANALLLESCLGVGEETMRALKRIEFGQAICGAVAVCGEPIVASHIQHSDDVRAALVRGLGIRVYACHPLIAEGQLLGTLSFASRTRDSFDEDEIEFLRTITRYVTVAYERARLVRELRATDRKKDDFIALLAHELRNPLAPLRNGLQVMRLAASDSRAVGAAREMMDRQLGHMVRLIDDLLDVSRISRNKLELRRAVVPLDEVIRNAVETARPAIEGARHQLSISLPSEPVLLDGDLTRLAQVFSNLLTNSAKYTEAGGAIAIHATREPAGIAISVRDNGIGIPSDALPTIFDMFSQVDRSFERSAGGLGIGLALVRGLVEMHGGTVIAESAGVGKGSVFTVHLPVPNAAIHAPHGDVPEPVAHAGIARRVLVADDNVDSAGSMQIMLELLGYEVRVAHDGLDACAIAESFRPDVVLMDVGMPRVDGHEATRRIRAQPWGDAMVIVALTGWGQEHDRVQSKQAGCDHHLVKPVELSVLRQLLADVLIVHSG
jgi:PAS domain S-box-containing protein